ncbi:MAG: C69 family dipeptidase [Candidatus Latescibacterota bacterium]|nr:MAG: C69 family dipeptidase [Candidatus Latescibacterota bacterium]
MKALATAALAASLAITLITSATPPTLACTNLIVTKGATTDGSVTITYTCDGEFHPRMRYYPAADHEPDSVVEIKDWSGNVHGTVKQVPHTYAVVYLMNEHQLVIGETTFGGREELENPDGLLHYWWLMRLALERAKTAREAIEVMTSLVAEYGYRSTGESFSIADPNEAWLMEMIGPGPGGEGAQWVAMRVPDGYVCAHANMSRIGEFPLDDPENCLYSENVISFAVDKGYYDPGTGEPFRFNHAYNPPHPEMLRYAATRVWSLFRRVAPSQNWSPDYHRGVPGAERYPLWIKPDKKISTADVFALMRDHYEGTEYDMTKGVDAGPFGSPNRWRPMTWDNDGATYSWERPISTQQTGFSYVSQSRSWLPDAVGGVLWYGVDDTYTTCYVPMYCGINEIPESFRTGSLGKFSWDSAWWVFNLTANYANLKYSHIIEDIQSVQTDLESTFFSLQPVVEKNALELAKKDPSLLTRYLTDYSVGNAEMMVDRWRELCEFVICKYNDGYVKDEKGRPQEVGYPETWLENVMSSRPNQFKLESWGDKTAQKDLLD